MLEVTMKFYGGYKYKCPSKRRRDRLRKERFWQSLREILSLCQFPSWSLAIPLLLWLWVVLSVLPSPLPSWHRQRRCCKTWKIFVISGTAWHRRLVRLKRSGRRCVSRCGTWGQLWEESWRVWSKSSKVRKKSWHSLRPEKKCWRPLVLHLEYQSRLQGCPWVLQLSQVHPKWKGKRKKKTPWPALTRRDGVLYCHT